MKKKRLSIEEHWWQMLSNGNRDIDRVELRAMIWMARDEKVRDKAAKRLLALVEKSDNPENKEDIKLIILWSSRMREYLWKKWRGVFTDDDLLFLWEWCKPLRRKITMFNPKIFTEKN